MTETTIDLQPFCAVDDIRSYMAAPFVVDGHTCATNGHILVRVPGGAAPENEVMIAGSVRKMFEREYDDFVPLPSLPDRVPCSECAGEGRIEDAECDDCDGRGGFWHGSHEYECKECDGEGTVGMQECCMCYGFGEVRTVLRIQAATFDVRYLRKIADLPNVRISAPTEDGAAAFVFDGGDGRLMPCRDAQ